MLKPTRAIIPYSNGKKVKSSFYKAFKHITLKDDSQVEIYYRGVAKFYVDIPIGNNQCGFIYSGTFYLIFKAHPNTKDFFYNFDKVQSKLENYNYSDMTKYFKLAKLNMTCLQYEYENKNNLSLVSDNHYLDMLDKCNDLKSELGLT